MSTTGSKCGAESETASWILSNTKKCPMCGVRIEKNQGCNHMQCRNSSCRHEWCWVCTGPWAEHGQSTGGYYKCNKFKASAGAAAGGKDSSGAKAAQELDRYLFYFQRYANHDAAGRFAAKHRQATARRMQELQAAGGLSYSDVTFLDDATEALLECRKALKYTYVLAYYLPEDSADRGLFEHLQEQLERSTEHLAELTEKPVDKMDRVEVVNFTRVTLQFLKNLIAGLEEGLTGGF
jgi:ariadne-1